MARRSTAAYEARRAARRQGLGPDGHERASLAQIAARMIAEHGIDDWSAAKRKAARELGLPERAALPRDDEIEDALADYHAIFGGDEHAAMLRTRRTEALTWLRNLAQFEPRLVGGVAAGWATEYSDIRIELVAEDTKSVEIALLNAGIAFRAMPDRMHDDAYDLYVDTPRGGVRLRVRTPGAMRGRPRRDRHGRDELRLDADAVAKLLESRDLL